MKLLLLCILSGICLSSCSQKVKTRVVRSSEIIKWPTPIKDSTCYYLKCDTVFGEIEFKLLGGGILKGKGMVLDCWSAIYTIPVYSKKDMEYIDSVQTAIGIWSSEGHALQQSVRAYIKINGSWKEQRDPYTIIANNQ